MFCDITITGLQTLRIYPLPDETFWVNLKEYISSLLNDYGDDLDFTIDNTDLNSYVKDWSKVLFNDDVDFVITFDNESTDSATVTPYIVLGGENIYDYKTGETIESNENVILSPLKLKTSNNYHLRYWNGYPFDLPYTLNRGQVTDDLIITNLTNAIATPAITFGNKINRLIVSDGETDTTLEDWLPLINGFNRLQIEGENVDVFLDLIKENECDGVYLKWLNKYGGYNYWLFNRFFEITKRVRDKGSINNDFNNLNDTISQFKKLGKTSFDIWTLQTDILSVNDVNVLKGIFTSPKIYLFTGERFASNSNDNWIEINLTNTQALIQEPKQTVNTFEVNIELPNDYNISL